MNNNINEYFEQGILAPAYQAERNILIWQHIADEYLEIEKDHRRKLYSFIQQSAQTNYILSLGKLFDTPSKRYPTRCIKSFLELLKSPNLVPAEIIETTNTIRTIKDNKAPVELIDAINNKNWNKFPSIFADYYLKRYQETTLQVDLEKLKTMRDKAEAHNEAIVNIYLGFHTTTALLAFALEIISIFGMAYRSEGWKINGESFVTLNAERGASFIKVCIDELKKSPN